VVELHLPGVVSLTAIKARVLPKRSNFISQTLLGFSASKTLLRGPFFVLCVPFVLALSTARLAVGVEGSLDSSSLPVELGDRFSLFAFSTAFLHVIRLPRWSPNYNRDLRALLESALSYEQWHMVLVRVSKPQKVSFTLKPRV